jgi:hypothetical protein
MVARLDTFVSVESFDAGRESYQLGVLAGLGARARGDAAAGWQARVEAGKTPVEVLLADTAGAAQPEDPGLLAGANGAVDFRNGEIAREVTPLLARMKAADHVRLPVPSEWTLGSFGVSGFVTLVDEPGQPLVLLEYSGSHRVPGGGPTITVRQSIVNGRHDACGPDRIDHIVTFPAAAVTSPADGRFTVDTPQVRFSSLAATRVQDAAGLSWLCPSAVGSPPSPAPVATRRAPAPLACDRLRWLPR